MASGLNKAMIIGRLGQDPEVKFMPSGGAVCNVSVATSMQWKDKDSGDKREKTEWHRVVAFNRLAEVVGEYLKKGSQVYFEGRLQTRKWEDRDGNERYTTEIVAHEMQMLGEAKGGNEASGNGSPNRSANRSSKRQTAPAAAAPPDFDDDIPF